MTLWFWWWLIFVVLLLLIPLTYGWGYRGWGAPYPSYDCRRSRSDPAAPAADPAARAAAREAAGWGVVADILWIVLVVALVWLFLGLLL